MLSLVSNSDSVPGKVKRQHLCWTALKFPILILNLKGEGKLGRTSAAAGSYFLECLTCVSSFFVPCVSK